MPRTLTTNRSAGADALTAAVTLFDAASEIGGQLNEMLVVVAAANSPSTGASGTRTVTSPVADPHESVIVNRKVVVLVSTPTA